MRNFFRWTLIAGGVFLFACTSMLVDVQIRYLDRIVTDAVQTPRIEADVALVLGASVTGSGLPSDALKDRLDQGILLYKNGVKTILLSGDDGQFRARETPVMKEYVLGQGVPEKDVFVDGEGYRTYESCKHAAKLFAGKKAVIVTQRFHLARALYLCQNLGLDAQGVSADRHAYRRIVFFVLREVFASIKAWMDIRLFPPRSPVTRVRGEV